LPEKTLNKGSPFREFLLQGWRGLDLNDRQSLWIDTKIMFQDLSFSLAFFCRWQRQEGE
jgi:hypothetical protein